MMDDWSYLHFLDAEAMREQRYATRKQSAMLQISNELLRDSGYNGPLPADFRDRTWVRLIRRYDVGVVHPEAIYSFIAEPEQWGNSFDFNVDPSVWYRDDQGVRQNLLPAPDDATPAVTPNDNEVTLNWL